MTCRKVLVSGTGSINRERPSPRGGSLVLRRLASSDCETMPCAPMQKFGGSSKAEVGEVMSGVLEVIRGSSSASGGTGPFHTTGQRVFVRVYRISNEQHFAVLYPMRAIVTACRPLCSLNLKSCCVKPLSESGREFRVSPRACDGVAVTFRTLEGSTESHVAEWIQAFSDNPDVQQRRKKISGQMSPLPVLQESEEESEDSAVQV